MDRRVGGGAKAIVEVGEWVGKRVAGGVRLCVCLWWSVLVLTVPVCGLSSVVCGWCVVVFVCLG